LRQALKTEQFSWGDFHAPFDTREVAREALRRFDGRDGLGLVIEGVRDGWTDNVTRDLTLKIVGLQLAQREDPEQALLAWWNKHGQTFVQDRRAKLIPECQR